jgi:precorrin-6B methylase 2
MERIESLTRGEIAHGSRFLGRASLTESFAGPATGLDTLLGRLGSPLYTKEYPINQYVVWADAVGVFELMERTGPVTITDICSDTPLNEGGSDAILGVLCALGLLSRSPAGRYAMTADAREYCLRSSPYYIVDQLGAYGKPLPRPYFVRGRRWQMKLWWKLKSMLPNMRYGSRQRLVNQHVRNIPACAAAVRTGEFRGVKCMVDIAGGTGTFAIPLALENRVERIVLAELPQALENIRPYLLEHGVQNRVELLGMDALAYPWRIPACDGMFIGNFLHGFPDAICRRLCEEACKHLAPGGKLWVHEMIWNANKDGPLLTAMWNAAMRKGPGLQRTAQEIVSILESAGFVDTYVVPTSGIFALIVGRKPAG